MKLRTARLTTWVGSLALVSFVLLAGQASATPIVFTFDLSTGQSDEPNSVVSFLPNGTGGTVVHHISTLSPTLLVDTAIGAVIPSVSLSEYDGAISPLLKIGEYDFTNVIFTSVTQSGGGTDHLESFTFQSDSSTFTPGPTCASYHNFTFNLSTGESDDPYSIHSFSILGTTGSFAHEVDSFSPRLLQYTADGTHIPSAALGVYECAILDTLKIGQYDFTDLIFTGITHSGGLEHVSFQSDSATFTPVAAVPEPASLTLLGLGLAGMAGRRWRQRKA